MDKITKDKIINDVLKTNPQSLRVFTKYRIDGCCGSHLSIEEGAEKAKADLESLLKELNRTAEE